MRAFAPVIVAAALSLAAAAAAQPVDDDGYYGRGYQEDRVPVADYDGGRFGPVAVGGTGSASLDPWLSGTDEGARFVLRRFDRDGDGRIKPGAARRANVWFRRYADTDMDLRLTDAEIRIALVTVEKYAR